VRNQSSQESSSPARNFVPEVHPLERRIALTRTICFGNPPFCVPLPPPTPPRTGGVAVQSGSVATALIVATPPKSTVAITDDGKGDFQVEWDGGAVHSFTGVKVLGVEVEGPQSDQVTYDLTGPTSGSDEVAFLLSGKTNTVTANVSAAGPTGVTPMKLMGQKYTVVENKTAHGLSTSGLELLVHSKAGARTKVTTD